jgi:hypothetical protein
VTAADTGTEALRLARERPYKLLEPVDKGRYEVNVV